MLEGFVSRLQKEDEMTERFFIQETKRANCCAYLRQHSKSTLRPRSATESEINTTSAPALLLPTHRSNTTIPRRPVQDHGSEKQLSHLPSRPPGTSPNATTVPLFISVKAGSRAKVDAFIPEPRSRSSNSPGAPCPHWKDSEDRECSRTTWPGAKDSTPA